MAWSATSRFAGDRDSPGAARTFAAESLASLYDDASAVRGTCEDLAIIVSELVTNSVQADSPSIEVALEVDDGHLRVAVSDHVGGTPLLVGTAPADQPHGRGLAIVATLSQRWGVLPGPDAGPGKTVWAQLLLSPTPDRMG